MSAIVSQINEDEDVGIKSNANISQTSRIYLDSYVSDSSEAFDPEEGYNADFIPVCQI